MATLWTFRWKRLHAGYARRVPSTIRGALLTRPRLNEREIQILRALADGANSKELARIIGRSRGTAEAEIRVLFRKLEARSRHHLVAQAFRLGVLSAEQSCVADHLAGGSDCPDDRQRAKEPN